MTLKEVVEELKISERTIRKYCSEFYDFLDLDIKSFDYLFTKEMVERIKIIKNKLDKPGYAKVKNFLEYDKINVRDILFGLFLASYHNIEKKLKEIDESDRLRKIKQELEEIKKSLNKHKMTLKEVVEELNISERTIRKYCSEFYDFLDIDIKSFDYLFTNEMVERIKIIQNKLDKPGYAKVKNFLEYDKINVRDILFGLFLAPYHKIEKKLKELDESDKLREIKQELEEVKKSLKETKHVKIDLTREKILVENDNQEVAIKRPQPEYKPATKEEPSQSGRKKIIKIFRSEPTTLSPDDVKAMIKKHDFYEIIWNKEGSGFTNQFKDQTIEGDKIVIDQASGLIWQQGVSLEDMGFEETNKWIEKLNQKNYAGFNDWRLPTLEEAMSLIEPKVKYSNWYIHPRFEKKQRYIWTSDTVTGESAAWVVDFYSGLCYAYKFDGRNPVWAVRTIQSSEK